MKNSTIKKMIYLSALMGCLCGQSSEVKEQKSQPQKEKITWAPPSTDLKNFKQNLELVGVPAEDQKSLTLGFDLVQKLRQGVRTLRSFARKNNFDLYADEVIFSMDENKKIAFVLCFNDSVLTEKPDQKGSQRYCCDFDGNELPKDDPLYGQNFCTGKNPVTFYVKKDGSATIRIYHPGELNEIHTNIEPVPYELIKMQTKNPSASAFATAELEKREKRPYMRFVYVKQGFDGISRRKEYEYHFKPTAEDVTITDDRREKKVTHYPIWWSSCSGYWDYRKYSEKATTPKLQPKVNEGR